MIEEFKKRPTSNSIRIKNRNKMVEIVNCILYFNNLNQEGPRLKILTPSQMLCTLQISLAQLNAGNNSEKPKNEISQILHSLYRSKKLTKQI